MSASQAEEAGPTRVPDLRPRVTWVFIFSVFKGISKDSNLIDKAKYRITSGYPREKPRKIAVNRN